MNIIRYLPNRKVSITIDTHEYEDKIRVVKDEVLCFELDNKYLYFHMECPEGKRTKEANLLEEKEYNYYKVPQLAIIRVEREKSVWDNYKDEVLIEFINTPYLVLSDVEQHSLKLITSPKFIEAFNFSQQKQVTTTLRCIGCGKNIIYTYDFAVENPKLAIVKPIFQKFYECLENIKKIYEKFE